MIGSLLRQHSLFGFAFFKDVSRIHDPILSQIDAILDDPVLLKITSKALESRSSKAKSRGRLTIAPDRLLRCIALKHVKQWSFRQLEQELCSSLVYRSFTRFFEDPIPDHTAFCRHFALFGKDGTKEIHERVVFSANEADMILGNRLRTDTTAVETNIHYPTDSSLLDDSARVLTKALKRISKNTQRVKGEPIKVVNHSRAIKGLVMDIYRCSKRLGPNCDKETPKKPMQESYRKLMALTQKIVNQAHKTLEYLEDRTLRITGNMTVVLNAKASLEHYLPLAENVIKQTHERIINGNTRYPEKIFSIFEPHTTIICKGKAHKPNEYGRLVRIDEVENGIVSQYEVAEGNKSDSQQWLPALEAHRRLFGKAPRMASADRGYFSAKNEQIANEMGVQKVVLPARGRLSAKRKVFQKKRWFRRGLKWRSGVESRIATLKNRYGMKRSVYKGETGFDRHTGWSVIAQNLMVMGRIRLLTLCD